MTANEIRSRLFELVEEVNVGKLPKACDLAFHQQLVRTGNISVYLMQGPGRIYVQPNSSGCDVSLSGQVVEGEMYPFMRELFGKECDGFKQRNRNKGWNKQPFWRTSDFGKVKDAIRWYASNYSRR